MSGALKFSNDQQRAYDALLPLMGDEAVNDVYAVTGRAGSGKTQLLKELVDYAEAQGFGIIQPDFERKLKNDQRSLAILTPTNKASAVLRQRGVPATTLHRILYTPVYDPEYEQIADWLVEGGSPPTSERFDEDTFARAKKFYEEFGSVPGALAAIGARGADFIKGWKRREDDLDLGFVDESSMLDVQQIEDLKEIFSTLVLFGDPAQLAPIQSSDGMVFDQQEPSHLFHLDRVHRQEADNPILDLAHLLGEEGLSFEDFEHALKEAAERDERIEIDARIDTELMAQSPVLVWRNATRKRLIAGFRRAYDIQTFEMIPGEPLICDGIELPAKHRAKRIDLETRGLIKGAQISYLGAGRKPGFAKLYVHGTREPYISVASIIQIESPNETEPQMISAAKMGAVFLHGAASTIHKAQGSQWETVQIFAPDIRAAAFSGRDDAGVKLWKRLAYVALTRAENKIRWVTDYRMTKPTESLRFNSDDWAEPELALK